MKLELFRGRDAVLVVVKDEKGGLTMEFEHPFITNFINEIAIPSFEKQLEEEKNEDAE